MDAQEQCEINQKRPDHHFRTEIPNIIGEMKLNPITLSVYFYLKKISGDYGNCWMSIKNLSELCQISETKLKESLAELQSIEFMGKKTPLIEITHRKKLDGSCDTNLITIIDIWRLNGDYFRQKKHEGGVGRQKTQGGSPKNPGGSPNDYKEEPSQEEPLKELTTRQASVVVSPFLKKIRISESLAIKISKEHTPQEIELAVDRCLKWKTRSCDEAGILTALNKQGEWKDHLDKESVIEENKLFLNQNLKKYDETTYCGFKILVGPDYIEFISGPSVVRFTVDQIDFKSLIKNHKDKIKHRAESGNI